MTHLPTLEALRTALGAVAQKQRNAAGQLLTNFLHKLQVEQDVRIAAPEETVSPNEIGVFVVQDMRGWKTYFSDGLNVVVLTLDREGAQLMKRPTHALQFTPIGPADIDMVKRLINTLSNCDVHVVVASSQAVAGLSDNQHQSLVL